MRSFSFSTLLAMVFVFGTFIGCKKLVDVEVPGNRISSGDAYSSDATAIAVLNGLYSKLSSANFTSTATIPSITLWAGLSADEFKLWTGATSASQRAYYKNSLAMETGGENFG